MALLLHPFELGRRSDKLNNLCHIIEGKGLTALLSNDESRLVTSRLVVFVQVVYAHPHFGRGEHQRCAIERVKSDHVPFESQGATRVMFCHIDPTRRGRGFLSRHGRVQ